MSKPKLILYSEKLPHCTCYEHIFKEEFNSHITDSRAEFLKKSHHGDADVAIACFCFAKEKDAESLLQLDTLAGLIPVLSCSKMLTIDFIQMAARQGYDRFLDCNMEKEKILSLIHNAIRRGGLRQFLESWCQENQLSSPKVRKIIVEIIHAFPHWLPIRELAINFGFSERWLQKICRQSFRVTYSRLKRRIWVHQAMRMMKYTSLDNTEIALQLNYREETHLARDFRKELGANPTEMRYKLIEQTPEGLMNQIPV